MNIRQIARKLVWAENPKAGMFFAMTVVSCLMCVVAPALLYVAFAAAPIGKNAGMNWALIRLFTGSQGVQPILLLLFLYVALLTWRYYTAQLRTVFASKRRYALPLGFVATVAPVLGLFAVVLPCAIKTRPRKALLAFSAMTTCMILAVVATLSDSISPEYAIALILMSWLFHAAVIIHLPPGQVGRCAYVPTVLPILLVAVLTVADARLHAQLQILETDFHVQSRLSTTIGNFKAKLKYGISKEEPPYDTRFSGLAKITAIPTINPHGIDGGPTETQAMQFQDFATTNADLFAGIDLLTAQRNLKFGDDVDWHGQPRHPFDYIPPLEPYSRLGHWYLAKGRYVAWRGDGATADDCIDLIDNLSTWLARNPDSSSQLYRMILENLKLLCIEAAVPVLSDVELAEQQKRMRVSTLDYIERCRMNQIASYILFADAMNTIAVQDAFGLLQGRSTRRLCRPVFRFYVKLEKRCALQDVIHEFSLFDGAHSEPEIYAELEGDEHEWWIAGNVRLPMSLRLRHSMPAYRRFADAIDRHRAAELGLAVERYRRRHGRLPEDLKALLPEFMESQPSSTATGKPFEYQRGAFDIPWLLGERRTRRVIGYRVFSRHGTRRPRMEPGFAVWLGDAPGQWDPRHPRRLHA